MSFEIKTFGCRLNISESNIIEKHVKKAGLDNIVIFNSCAVTEEAEKKLRQAIRKVRKDSPDKKIIVTGCASQIDPKKYKAIADTVIGNAEKLNFDTYRRFMTLPSSNTKITTDYYSTKRTRGFLQIQNGCNHRCTFCIIPYGRGNNASVPVGEIVRRAQKMISSDCREVVLTGVDITGYGSDLPGKPTLATMIERLLKAVPNILRLRLSSVDIAEIDESLWNLIIEEQRIMPHIHLSLQSGDDMILKRMKRRHNTEQVYRFCRDIKKRRPEVSFGADVIAGFPTETDTMFKNTYNLLQDLNITHLHVFPYSIRHGTPAARMPQVDPKIIIQRARILRNLKESLLSSYLKKKIGTYQKVLIESNYLGYTEDYCQVKMVENFRIQEIHKIMIKSVIGNRLVSY